MNNTPGTAALTPWRAAAAAERALDIAERNELVAAAMSLLQLAAPTHQATAASPVGTSRVAAAGRVPSDPR